MAQRSSMIRDFVTYGRQLFEQGLNNSHSGNMSCRDGKGFLITRHGAQLGHLKSADIVRVNIENNAKDAHASLETAVHRAVYLACPSIKAIVHAHTPYAVVLSLASKAIKPLDAEGSYYLPAIPVLNCSCAIASAEVARKLPAMLAANRVAIVKGHGAFAGAESIEEAAMLVSVAESASRIIYLEQCL